MRMIINCPHCSARVNGEVEKLFPMFEREEDGTVIDGFRVSLLECPSCHQPLVGREILERYEEHRGFGEDDIVIWGGMQRVWPDPEALLDASIPEDVRVSLEEAKNCLACGGYTASVVMSGRALEAVARHFHVEKVERLMLGKGLEELHASGKIDERLYRWGKELHEHRNLAAHATAARFARADAEDLYEFANAICEYLFVLQDRFDRFMQRKANKTGV
jgi:hypothetical protein